MDYLRQIHSEGPYQLPPPPGYAYAPPQEEKEVHLRDYWKIIRKRIWIVIAFFFDRFNRHGGGNIYHEAHLQRNGHYPDQ